MTEHPEPAILTDFLLGKLAPGQARPVIGHLLRGCERCQEEMEPLALAILSAQGSEPALTPEEEAAYDGAISEACRKTLEALREEQATAAKIPGRKGVVIPSPVSEIQRHASGPAPRPASR